MKTVIEMAIEAGLIDFRDPLSAEYTKAVLEDLTGFAELVRADERKKVRAAMKKAHVRLLKNAIAAERNSWPAEMEAMERQVNILTDALAEARSKP